jgi:hypothetical protein
MDEATIRAFAEVVDKSLQTTGGEARLRSAHQYLLQQYSKGSFNSERALEVYTIAIERSVLSFMSGTQGLLVEQTLKEVGITRKMAMELVDQFKEATGATDQRPARRGFLAKIVGR